MFSKIMELPHRKVLERRSLDHLMHMTCSFDAHPCRQTDVANRNDGLSNLCGEGASSAHRGWAGRDERQAFDMQAGRSIANRSAIKMGIIGPGQGRRRGDVNRACGTLPPKAIRRAKPGKNSRASIGRFFDPEQGAPAARVAEGVGNDVEDRQSARTPLVAIRCRRGGGYQDLSGVSNRI